MFTLKISTDNEAFTNDAGLEIARILRNLADKVESWPGANDFSIGLRDFNGNKIGSAEGSNS